MVSCFPLLLVIPFLLLQSTTQIGLRRRYFNFEHVGACPAFPTNIGKLDKFVIDHPDKSQYYVDGQFTFFKNITAPVRFHIRSIRCSLSDNSKCIHNDGMQFGLCEHLNDKMALWTPFVATIDPKLMCPIKMGTYKIKNGTMDFSVIEAMPLDGWRYNLSFRFYELTKPKPTDILCIDFVVQISTLSNNPSRRRRKPTLI